MYLRSRTDIANLPFNEEGGVDCFEGLNRLLRLARILLKRQRGRVEDHGVEPHLGGFYSLFQRVRMVRVKKNRKIKFVPQASHQSRNLTDSHELALPLGRADENRDL